MIVFVTQPQNRFCTCMFTLFLSKVAASPTNVFSKTRGARNYFRQWGIIFHSILGACLFIFFFQISWRIITMLPDTILRCFIKSPAPCIKLPDKFLILFPKQNLLVLGYFLNVIGLFRLSLNSWLRESLIRSKHTLICDFDKKFGFFGSLFEINAKRDFWSVLKPNFQKNIWVSSQGGAFLKIMQNVYLRDFEARFFENRASK